MEPVAAGIWQKSKLLVKGLLIGFLVLLLLIPTHFVTEIIAEREARQKEAFHEISSKWAGRQDITGPVLVLPYKESATDEKGQAVEVRKHAVILPDQLIVEAGVEPERRHRGIYEVMLYSSKIAMKGAFNPLPLQQLKIDPAAVAWNEAYICLGLADSKGLKEEIRVMWNDSIVTLNPSILNNGAMKEGFMSPVSLSADQPVQFSSTIELNGSEQLLFTPVGKETRVTLSSSWPDPSFTGGQLPEYKITGKGFTATWKSLAHTRNFPQAWKENSYNLAAASFGTDLFIPVNGYQKTMRSVKYAILCIILTFAAFFITETIHKKSVHPFQYALIGLALILFYTLLLSFSEYVGFNTSYAIASVATIALIAWFVKGVLQSSRLTTILSFVLVLMYSYIFSLLQLQDYSLIMGSIGLFITLAVIMHFSKKIQW
jgi:inner membrane protein